jgi:hypothetical protein
MRITLKWLEKHGACTDGKDAFAGQKERDGVKILKTLIANKQLEWASWLVCRVFTHKQRIQYAVFAAEQVLHIFEAKHPDDKRPRLAIEAAKKVIERDTAKNRADAAAAYAAAAAAADAAATYDAADAAATYDAAAAATYDAARTEMQIKILTYGLSLLEGE